MTFHLRIQKNIVKLATEARHNLLPLRFPGIEEGDTVD